MVLISFRFCVCLEVFGCAIDYNLNGFENGISRVRSAAAVHLLFVQVDILDCVIVISSAHHIGRNGQFSISILLVNCALHTENCTHLYPLKLIAMPGLINH
jgi:hypothetical protein